MSKFYQVELTVGEPGNQEIYAVLKTADRRKALDTMLDVAECNDARERVTVWQYGEDVTYIAAINGIRR